MKEPAWIIINNISGKQDTNSIKTALLPYMELNTINQNHYHHCLIG